MQFSYWEIKSWFQNVNFTIVGSGIVGLSCALSLRKRFPKSKILVLEKGMLPSGASTKNAGFTCFGSISEIIDDLNTHTEEEAFNLVKKRVDGLKLLRKNLGDTTMDFQLNGGFELFRNEDLPLFEYCEQKLTEINALLKPIFKKNTFEMCQNRFGFNNIIDKIIYTPFEGQIDTGKMMIALINKAMDKNILILNGASVFGFSDQQSKVKIQLNNTFEYTCDKLFIATNGFANQILNEKVKPARAQVLITKPIKNLKLKGNFHLDKGYNYFRNIDGRILLGGGRNLDFAGEETTDMTTTHTIQQHLENLLKQVILPKTTVEIEHRWSGIMGVGSKKKPIVKQVSENVYCGIRLGGMGVAIGSVVGADMAELI